MRRVRAAPGLKTETDGGGTGSSAEEHRYGWCWWPILLATGARRERAPPSRATLRDAETHTCRHGGGADAVALSLAARIRTRAKTSPGRDASREPLQSI